MSRPITRHLAISRQTRMDIIFSGSTRRLRDRDTLFLAIRLLEGVIHTGTYLEERAECNRIFAPATQVAGTAVGLHIEVVLGTRLQTTEVAEGIGGSHLNRIGKVCTHGTDIPCVVGGEIRRNLHLNHLGTQTIHRSRRHIARRGLLHLEIVHVERIGVCARVQLCQDNMYILARAVGHRTGNLRPVGRTRQRIDGVNIVNGLEQAVQIGDIGSITDDNSIRSN